MNRVLSLGAVLVILAATSGCSRSDTKPTTTMTHAESTTTVPPATSTTRPVPGTAAPGVSIPDVAGVDRNNVDAVTDAVLSIFYTVDTDVDGGPNDAARRALPLLTQAYADGITRTPPAGSPGAEWLGWAAHHATTTVAVAPLSDNRPPDSPTAAYRIRSVRISPHGRDGVELPVASRVIYVVLERTATGWVVAKVSER